MSKVSLEAKRMERQVEFIFKRMMQLDSLSVPVVLRNSNTNVYQQSSENDDDDGLDKSAESSVASEQRQNCKDKSDLTPVVSMCDWEALPMSYDNVYSNPACTLKAQGASMVGFSNDANLLQTTSSPLCEAPPTETDLLPPITAVPTFSEEAPANLPNCRKVSLLAHTGFVVHL